MHDETGDRRLTARSVDRPTVVAHRGFAGVAPENTLGALEAVADGTHPADAVEVDVVPCADGTPVVFHDARLDGADDGRGRTDLAGAVWETPLSALADASVLGTDEHVPTLASALAALPADVAVNVELKNPGTTDLRPGAALSERAVADRRARWDGFVERVVAVLEGVDNELLISSFCEAAIASVRELAPSLPVAPLLTDVDAGLTVAERYACEAIHPPLAQVLAAAESEEASTAPGGDRDLLAAARALGCAVNAWTVRTWHEADRLRAAGVDGLIADYPGLLGWTDAR